MSSSIARIHVNGVEVGSLPVEVYNSIVSTTRQDRRLYLAYAFRGVGLIARLLEPIGHIPPVEAEAIYYQQLTESAQVA